MNLHETLKHYFGYDSLRAGQQELIEGILDGRDVLGIMPTGAGKSLCYQLPALMMGAEEGRVTLVISPLISLMADQVKALNQAGIHAAYINSTLTENQIRLALEYARQGRYTLVYVTPERLGTAQFLEFACNADIAMVTVDEAHCISQWGQDFRPSYLEIARFIDRLPARPVVSAFTATATDMVRQDIIRNLELESPVTVVTGFDRPNLFFKVVNRKGGRETDNSILNYVKRHEDESGIIYCATKKNVEKVHELLLANGVPAGRYHAGLSLEDRKRNQEDFTYDRIKVMVATNAFTMSPSKWIESTNAVGIVSKSGRNGGTFAHSDIAFEFASWISPEFKLYIIKDYNRLKHDENSRLSLSWNLNREISKLNYRIHTDAYIELLGA